MASNHQKTIDQRRHTWCSAKIRKGTSPPWVESAINDANCAWKRAKVQGNMVVDQSEHNLRWKGSFYPPPNIRKKRSKKLKGTRFQMMHSYPKQYNICQTLISNITLASASFALDIGKQLMSRWGKRRKRVILERLSDFIDRLWNFLKTSMKSNHQFNLFN